MASLTFEGSPALVVILRLFTVESYDPCAGIWILKSSQIRCITNTEVKRQRRTALGVRMDPAEIVGF